ncbi:MAG: hypothetical protein GY737_00930, partial [Desulfobacteraceae bacterium]|nr:hypothetical protein [Desulfobacteraceae bacterium]
EKTRRKKTRWRRSTKEHLITAKETSFDTYKALKDYFEKTNATNVYYLLAQLNKLELKEGGDVEKHLKIFAELCDKLLAVELELPQPVKIAALLGSLPPSFHVLRTTLQMKGEALNLDEVIQAIATEEQQRRGGDGQQQSLAESGAFVAYGRGRGRGGNQTSGRGGSENRWPIRCFKCNGLGHIARYCRVVDENQPRDGEREMATPADERLIFANADVYENNCCDDWIVDSGASCHMAASRSVIDNYRAFEQPRKVRLGDGRVLPAFGQGRVRLDVETGGRKSTTMDITLVDVLLVPGLSCNLISIRAALDRGKTVEFACNGCQIKTSSGKTLAFGRREEKLFKLNVRKKQGDDNYEVAGWWGRRQKSRSTPVPYSSQEESNAKRSGSINGDGGGSGYAKMARDNDCDVALSCRDYEDDIGWTLVKSKRYKNGKAKERLRGL